jgi:NAD+ kinase
MSRTIGLIANPRRESALTCARSVIEWLAAQGVAVRLEQSTAAALGLPEMGASEAEVAEVELIVALGGDGTLLAASRVAATRVAAAAQRREARLPAPILGIHSGGPGSFGFLTETVPARAREALARVLRGDFHVEERMRVAAEVVRDGERVAEVDALNDLVIGKSDIARMLKMRVFVGDTFIATYAADGIIVATPTGSTAYNLAANGPLVHPSVPLIILTPICPHTLNVRSLLIGDTEQARVVIEGDSRSAALLTVDGQVGLALRPGDDVRCFRAAVGTRLLVLDGDSFYQKLQTRLRLGERFSSEGAEGTPPRGMTGEGCPTLRVGSPLHGTPSARAPEEAEPEPPSSPCGPAC